MYVYQAKCLRVVDGDTVDVLIDLGFNTHSTQRLRLFGIDAPESRTRDLEEKERGKAATRFLQDLIENSPLPLIVKTVKDSQGKYGRYLATLYLGNQTSRSINATLVEQGHATYKEY